MASTRPVGFALGAQHLAEPLFQLVGADGLGHRQFRAAPAGARDTMAIASSRTRRERAEGDQGVADADRPVADHEKNLVHAAL